MYFSQPKYQSRCRRRLPNLNVPYFKCDWMHVQLRHIYVSLKTEAIKIFKLCVFLIVNISSFRGCFTWISAWKNGLSSIPPTFPFTWLSAQGMVLVALTAEYQECLKVVPFDVHYQCISAWLHCDCSTRMRCVDTFCWHLSRIYLYREDAWNVPVSLFFLNVVISLSLNDFAYNILNDELKIMFTWSCWKLALQ